jgi:hypothetical protein
MATYDKIMSWRITNLYVYVTHLDFYFENRIISLMNVTKIKLLHEHESLFLQLSCYCEVSSRI